MQSALAVKYEDHPAPPPLSTGLWGNTAAPRVMTLIHYTRPAEPEGFAWESRPNPLSKIVFRNQGPRPIQLQAEIVTAIRALADARADHEAKVAKANDSLQRAMQHVLAEEKRVKEMAAQQHSADLVPRTAVIRGASIIVGAMTLLAWLGTVLGGTVLVHPLLSVMLMIGSVVFYAMSKVEK